MESNLQENKLYGLIYKTTNIINNKIYIGQTTNIDKWNKGYYKGSGEALVLAILKYGKQNFKSEFICYANSQLELDDLETFYIKEFNSLVPNGYNISLGGFGYGKRSDESKLKISLFQKGRKHSDETKIKKSKSMKGKNLGKKLSEEHKLKISLTSRNRKHSDETKLKLSQINKGKNLGKKRDKEIVDKIALKNLGKKRSDETKLKMSEKAKGRISHNKGKTISDETKLKISIAMKKRILARNNIIY